MLSSFLGERPAFVACSTCSLVRMCIPSHLTAKILIALYFKRKCKHVTAYETGTMKRLPGVGLVPRERGYSFSY